MMNKEGMSKIRDCGIETQSPTTGAGVLPEPYHFHLS
jgi:hypothetical protein